MIREKKEKERRVFISIPLERHFSSVFSRYRDTHGRIPYLRWKPEKNLHVTVLFIGSVSEEQYGSIVHILADIISHHVPFSLILKKVSYAPPDRQADMVWAYFEQSDALDTLAYALHDALSQVGIVPLDSLKKGRETLLPHITLARFNEKQVRALRELRRTELEGHHMLVEEIQLLESLSTPNGTMFKLLETYEFTSPAQ